MRGKIGPPGANGSKGDAGFTGMKGHRGLMGLPGIPGEKGNTGNDGPPGRNSYVFTYLIQSFLKCAILSLQAHPETMDNEDPLASTEESVPKVCLVLAAQRASKDQLVHKVFQILP